MEGYFGIGLLKYTFDVSFKERSKVVSKHHEHFPSSLSLHHSNQQQHCRYREQLRQMSLKDSLRSVWQHLEKRLLPLKGSKALPDPCIVPVTASVHFMGSAPRPSQSPQCQLTRFSVKFEHATR